MKSLLTGLLFLAACTNQKTVQKEKDFNEKANELVLSEHKPGIGYFFKIGLNDEVEEYRITYLGDIQTRNGKVLKFINNIIYSGENEDSKRASATVDIYDNMDQYMGSYQVGPDVSLPSDIEGSSLVFAYNNEDCHQKTVIDFADSIPRKIFIKCKGESGDIYSFTTGDKNSKKD